MAETDLYAPVKAFLERQDYVVKAEVKVFLRALIS